MNIATVFKIALILLITYIPLHASNVHIVHLGIGSTFLASGLIAGYYTEFHVVELYQYIKNGEFNDDYYRYKKSSAETIPNKILNKFTIPIVGTIITLLLSLIGLKILLSN